MINLKCSIKKILLNNTPAKILQPIKKIHYLHTLRKFPESNKQEFKIIKYLLKPGNCVVDIGANIGIYTKYLSELVGNYGSVFSIEPIPLTFDILSYNIKKLGLKNVNLFKIAISDTIGENIMQVPLYDTGGENFYEASIVKENINNSLRHIKVESKTIDSLFDKTSLKISFIKLDTEGHELECIKGAINTIQRFKPAWLIEISQDLDDLKTKSYETFKLLNQYGYLPYWFDGSKLNKRSLGDKSINYFFLTTEHLEILKNSASL